MTDDTLVSACREWTAANTETDREAVRAKVRTALSGAATAKEAEARAAFDGAIAAASAATSEAEALATFKGLPVSDGDTPTAPVAREIGQIADPMPDALFTLPGDNAAVVPLGEVAILAGEGGTGKSTLASELALAVANAHATAPLDAMVHGPVLWLAWEERAGLIAARASARGFTRGIHVLDMRGGRWPLFGPGGGGPYNAKPVPLAGWEVMDREAARIVPRLIVLDPALSAFVGEPNAAPPVREFVERLAAWATGIEASVLILAHATKERDAGPFDRSQAGGSGAWTDAARCALTLTHGDGSGERSDGRTLAVLKSNSGPAFTWTAVTPFRKPGSRWIVGFDGGTWKPAHEWKSTSMRDGGRIAESDQCSALTKAGDRCLQDATKDGLCKLHSRIAKRGNPGPTDADRRAL